MGSRLELFGGAIGGGLDDQKLGRDERSMVTYGGGPTRFCDLAEEGGGGGGGGGRGAGVIFETMNETQCAQDFKLLSREHSCSVDATRYR